MFVGVQVLQIWDFAIIECNKKIAAVESAHQADMQALASELADLKAQAAASAKIIQAPVRL